MTYTIRLIMGGRHALTLAAISEGLVSWRWEKYGLLVNNSCLYTHIWLN